MHPTMGRREASSLPDQSNFINPFASSHALTPIVPTTSSPLRNCDSSSMSPRTAMSIKDYPHETETDASSDGYDSDATLDLENGISNPLAAAFLKDAPPLRRMSRDYERVVLRSLSYSQAGGVAYACACSRNEGQACSKLRQFGKWADDDDERESEYDSDVDGEDEEYYLEESSDVEGSRGLVHKATPFDSSTGADNSATNVELYENFVNLLLSDASTKLVKLDAARDTTRCKRTISMTRCAEAPF